MMSELLPVREQDLLRELTTRQFLHPHTKISEVLQRICTSLELVLPVQEILASCSISPEVSTGRFSRAQILDLARALHTAARARGSLALVA